MKTEQLKHTIDNWIKELDQYTINQLWSQPSLNTWSLGQVYMHLIGETTYFIEQVKICAATNDNETEEASQDAKTMFLNNCFPDEIIEGPPSNAYTPQPRSKEQVINRLAELKNEIDTVEILISKNVCKGKTKHPGLNYFNAVEWLQFADMHFRHHLRQKKRIDEFLGTKSSKARVD
jgi:hypothetical protein